MGRCAFINPETGAIYLWTSNYEAETVRVRRRNVQTLEPAAAGWEQVKPIRLQGSQAPEVRRYSGTADDAQHLLMLVFYRLSASQSVMFQDVDGTKTEVFVTGYEPTRRGVVSTRGGANHLRNYTLDMEIV